MKNRIKEYLFTVKTNLNKNSLLGFPIWFWISILFFSFVKIFLTNGQQMEAIGGALHDDRLFINLADNLLNLKWLGDYNNLTLAKGPFYSIWIACNLLFGLPLLLTQQLLYLFATLMVVISLRPIINKTYFLFAIFLTLIFNPMSWHITRIVREDLYVSLTLLVVASSIALLARFHKKAKNMFFWSMLLGLSLPAFWLTREEGVWILPLVIPIIFYIIYILFKNKDSQWKLKIAYCIIPFFSLWILIFAISTINYYHYGIFSVVEFKNSAFLEAYGSLSRVRDSMDADWMQYLPVSKEKRSRIYAVSPSFKKLEPFIENDIGIAWVKISSENLGDKDSNEIRGGWFMWAFRDAVARAGYYSDGKTALNFYKQLAGEVNSACEKKDLDCLPKRKTMMPPWNSNYNNLFISSIVRSIKYTLSFKDSEVILNKSIGSEESINLFSQITNEPQQKNNIVAADTKKSKIIRGWAFSANDELALLIVDKNNNISSYSIKTEDSPDVYQYFLEQQKEFPNSKRARFEIKTGCIEKCHLLILVKNKTNIQKKIPLDGSIKFVDEGDMHVYIDNIRKDSQKEFKIKSVENINKFKINILNKMGFAYQLFMPIIIALSSLIFLLLLFKKMFFKSALFNVNGLILIVFLVRSILLSIIDTTSFPAIIIGYLSPLYPLAILFTAINFVLFLEFSFRKKSF